MSYKASKVAAAGYVAVAGLFFAIAITSSSAPSVAPNIAQAQEEAQLAREAAAKRLAAMVKRTSPMITANPKASAS